MKNVLLVDDDDQLRDSFENLLLAEGYAVRAAATGEVALRLAKEALPDAVIMDVRMPGMDGLTALRALHELEPRLPVIIMTAYSTTESAIEATKQGAFDYVMKPFDIPHVLEQLATALEAGRKMRQQVGLNAESDGEQAEQLVGTSRAMQELYKSIGRVAHTDALVLLRGESGTGKELVARALYQHSARSNRPFLIINCVAIPETLLESELFGYERGAFTGAVHRRVGKIEQASGGTVFLDEIGDIPISVQAKLLRLLQERQIERLGGRETVNVDVRILAATNRNLEEAVAAGRFREDLFYRLNVVALHLPPLRERGEDVPLLARHCLAVFAREMEVRPPELTPEALALLTGHGWPGNVRELRNLMQQLLIFTQGGVIDAMDVERALAGKGGEGGRLHAGSFANTPALMLEEYVHHFLETYGEGNIFDAIMDDVGARVVREALRLCEGNRSRTARMLGLSRPTLLAKIDKYGMGKE